MPIERGGQLQNGDSIVLGEAEVRKYFRQKKGKIEIDFDADLTLVDLKLKCNISASWLASKCGWSPFLDKTVTGWPVATILRGKTIMSHDELIGGAFGEAVTFEGH